MTYLYQNARVDDDQRYINNITDHKDYYKLSMKCIYCLKFDIYDSKGQARIISGFFEQNRKYKNFIKKCQHYFINTNEMKSFQNTKLNTHPS